MNRSLILFVLIFCAMFNQAVASESPVFVLKRKTQMGQIPDSISVSFQRENISTNYGREIVCKGLKPDRNGQFKFVLPEISHLSIFDVVFYTNKQIVRSNKYFAAPEDRLEIIYAIERDSSAMQKDKISLDFSGRGSIKYKVRDLLNKEFSMLWASLGKTNDRSITDCSPELQSRLEHVFASVQTSEFKATEILQRYSRELGEDLTKFYACEFNMSANTFSTFVFNLFNRVSSIECKRSIAGFYFSKRPVFDKQPATDLIKFSYHHVLYTGEKLMLESSMQNDGNKVTFTSRYDGLKSISDTRLRERLVVDFLMDPFLQRGIISFDSRDSCIADALTLITSAHLAEPLRRKLLFKKGSQVYDFSFIDTAGNIIKAKDLRGKVFMIDFYGEGCGGCAKFSKRFKEFIYPEFSSNKQFEVVSVSVDRTRERWIRAMNSGLYTQKSYVNLNTGLNGFSHPMLTYYHVNSIPFILLVDKNCRLISRIESHSNAEIAGMIREGLSK